MTTTTDTLTTETDNTFYFDRDYRDFNAYSQRVKFATIYRGMPFVGCAVSIFGGSLVILLMAITLFQIQIGDSWQFNQGGREVAAMITVCEGQQVIKRKSELHWQINFTYQYYVEERASSHPIFARSSKITNKVYLCDTTLLVGSEIQIEYLQDNPARSRIVDERLITPENLTMTGPFALIFFILGGVGVAFTLQEFIRAPLAYFRYREITHYGVLLDGEILEGKVDERSELVYVKYRFISPTFETLIGEQPIKVRLFSYYAHDSTLKAIKPGAPIKVLYANRRNFVAL